MAKRGKRPVPVNVPEGEKPIIINPNRIKVRDMRGILLSGCGPHEDKKKKANKYKCRRESRNDDSGFQANDKSECLRCCVIPAQSTY